MKNANIKTIDEAIERLVAGEEFDCEGCRVWFDRSAKGNPFRCGDYTLENAFTVCKEWEIKEGIDTYTKAEIWKMYLDAIQGNESKTKASDYPQAKDLLAVDRVIGSKFYLTDGRLVEMVPSKEGINLCTDCDLVSTYSPCTPLAGDEDDEIGCTGLILKEVKS